MAVSTLELEGCMDMSRNISSWGMSGMVDAVDWFSRARSASNVDAADRPERSEVPVK